MSPVDQNPHPGEHGDYGYDLAHEVPDARFAGSGSTRAPGHGSPPVLAENDRGQDYGYDLAHDIPHGSGS